MWFGGGESEGGGNRGGRVGGGGQIDFGNGVSQHEVEVLKAHIFPPPKTALFPL